MCPAPRPRRGPPGRGSAPHPPAPAPWGGRRTWWRRRPPGSPRGREDGSVPSPPPLLEDDVESHVQAEDVTVAGLVGRHRAADGRGRGDPLNADDVVANLPPDLVPAPGGDGGADAELNGGT